MPPPGGAVQQNEKPKHKRILCHGFQFEFQQHVTVEWKVASDPQVAWPIVCFDVYIKGISDNERLGD